MRFLIFIACFTFYFLNGQIIETPKFKASCLKTSVKKGEIIDVIISCTVPNNWHLYSNTGDCNGNGPIEAEIKLNPNASFSLVGSPTSVGDKIHRDDIFECSIGEFRGQAKFIQKIKVLSTISNLNLSFNGQMCTDDASGRCVPVKDKFELAQTITVLNEEAVIEPTVDPNTPTEPNNGTTTPTEVIPNKVKDTCACNNAPTSNLEAAPALALGHYAKKDKNDGEPCLVKSTSDVGKKGWWGIFIAALLSGFLGLLTPCVFPMIPMTVSFFMKNKNRKQTIREALTFAFSIIAIYVILGTIISFIFGASAGNFLSTHWFPNVLFFVIFVIFAASFLGAFEIVLPAWIVNKTDQQVDKGGFLGPVFMALTIALVSFSCTGPIVGSVLVQSATLGKGASIVAMLGFGLAFALPFGFFALFPSYLKSLPKSGGWLNSVKVCLGFLELALALKFLSVADQTYHLNLLDREVYLSLWIVIFALMGFYLLGKLKFSHDSDLPYLKVPRLIFAIITLSFTVYMVPGLWGAPLKFLAGFLPPISTQDFVLGSYSNSQSGNKGNVAFAPSYANTLHIPQNIAGYFDYEEAIEAAKILRKPVFIDFTGHGCVNCRKMEEKVWSDKSVSNSLKTDFVVASLYVDDKTIVLPKNQHFIGRYSNEEITMLGEKNTEIEACYFNTNSQPLYVILDPFTEKVLTPKNESAESNGYNATKFLEFLNLGSSNFKSLNR